MDKLESMKVFIRVVEAGSFVRAAEQLSLPASTVTRLVQSLESEVGVKLLNRSSRRLSMTEQGEICYQGAVRLLEQVDILEGHIREGASLPRGKLHIELPNAFASYYLIPRLPDFLRQYPDVQVVIGISNQTADLIEKNIDCVIRIGHVQNESLVARSLGNLRRVTCASPGYLQQHGQPVEPAQLARDHRLVQIVSAQSGRPFVHRLVRDQQTVELTGHSQIAVNDAVGALKAGLAGLGVVTTYEFLVQEHLASGALVALFPDWQNETVPLHIAWSANRHLPSKLRCFIDWVKATMDT